MIYLDYQATTPLAPEAREAMLPWLDRFGNPHSSHRIGREAKAAVEQARAQIAAPFDAGGRLLFTSGATEAANWALKGLMAAAPAERRKLVTIATEHSCVLAAAEWLRAQGCEVAVLPVGRDGLVDLHAARAAIDERAALVAAMLVNNEIGVVQPIAELGAIAHAAGALMFCDAVQGYGRVALPAHICDAVAITGHKIHAPKGIGALWLHDGVVPETLMHGGAQEGGIRSGTLSPMLCAGFGAAAALAHERADADRAHVERLRDRLVAALGEGWRLNGDARARYAGNLNLRRDGLDANRLISEVREVAFSAGSACASGSGRESHVLRAIGLSEAQARGSIRLGFGRYTTAEEIDRGAALVNAAALRQREWA